MKLMKFDEFTSVVNNLVNYYKELKDLKEAGLDLSKFDAHKTLFSLVFENLAEQFGAQATIEILRYAENPQIGNVKDLWEYVQTYLVKETPKVDTIKCKCEGKPKCDEFKENTSKKKSKFTVDGIEVTEDDYREAVKKFNDILESVFTELFK